MPIGTRRSRRPSVVLSGWGSAGDEDVLGAVVVEWGAIEAAVHGLHLEAGDVDEAEPLVLRGPPQRAGSAIVQDDVDTVVADREVISVCERALDDADTIGAGGEVMVEGERVPGEAASHPKRRHHPLEDAAARRPGGEME